MIGAWFAFIPAILVGAAFMFVPGLAVLSAIRMRGLGLVAFAPVVSTALIGASAIVLGLVGVPWTPLTFGAIAAAVGGIAWMLRWILTVPDRQEAGARSVRGRLLLVSGLLVGATLLAFRLMSYIQSPENVSQTNDAVFHLNAVRFILETGSASSFHVSGFIGGAGFYPAAWHGLVSLIAISGVADIPVAANASTLLIGAVVWPLGIAWLGQAVTRSAAVAAYSGILAGALWTFPFLMFQWGVLYPNALSTALIPAALALVVFLGDPARWPGLRPGVPSWVLRVLLVGIAFAAIGLAQPAGLLIWLLLAMIYLTFLALFSRKVRRVPAILCAVIGWAALAVLWSNFSGSTSGAQWGPITGRVGAGIDILTNSEVSLPPVWTVSVLAIIGLIACVVRPSLRWFALAWVATSGLYFLIAAIPGSFVRDRILGAWYADPNRIAAIAPIVVIPLAAIGIQVLVRLILRATHRSVEDARAIGTLTWVGSLGAVVVVVIQLLVAPTPTPEAMGGDGTPSTYHEDGESYLSTDERALLEELPELVPDDAVVIANPSTGSGFGYMISGRDVIPKTWSPPMTDSWWLVANHLRDASTDPAVCEALAEFGDVEYVLDFGEGEASPGKWLMEGLTDFDGRPGFERVESVGNAKLWRITACAH